MEMMKTLSHQDQMELMIKMIFAMQKDIQQIQSQCQKLMEKLPGSNEMIENQSNENEN